jgi:hypothetical protein
MWKGVRNVIVETTLVHAGQVVVQAVTTTEKRCKIMLLVFICYTLGYTLAVYALGPGVNYM